MLGARGVDVRHEDSASAGSSTSSLSCARRREVLEADYGQPPARRVGLDRDVVPTWNGTSSGVRVPGGD
jgi:hypothetical protein